MRGSYFEVIREYRMDVVIQLKDTLYVVVLQIRENKRKHEALCSLSL